MVIRIGEVFRTIFYAPLYAAVALGNFDKEGLDITLSTSPKPEKLPELLLSGDIEVGCGGPMAVMLGHEQNPKSDLVIFCALLKKDPFFVVGREPQTSFKLSDLRGKIFAPMPESPTPWLLLQNDLKEAGIAIDDLSLASAATMQENVDRFRRGELDAIQISEPFVSQLKSEGLGHIWYSGAERGDIGFSALYTTRRFAGKYPDALPGIARAMYKTQQWLASASTDEIADLIQPFLPEHSKSTLMESIENYRRYDVWADVPLLSRGSYERLRDACISGGLFNRETPYEAACIPEIAQQVLSAATPTSGRPNLHPQ